MLNLNILLQASASSAQAQPDFMQQYDGIIMIVALIAIFYFMMIRPQQKRQKKIREARQRLTAGSKVVTAGGIHGKITKVADNTFSIEIANGTVITVEKGSVYPLEDGLPADGRN